MTGTAFDHIPKGQLFPCISLKKLHESVQVNFGQDPFVFSIDDVVKVGTGTEYKVATQN